MDSLAPQTERLSLFQKILLVCWLSLTVLGAMNSTVLPWLSGGKRLNLAWLPHLRYGHVMFNKNPLEVTTIWFRSHHTNEKLSHISELIKTPAPAYKQARVAINLFIDPRYLISVCKKKSGNESLEFVLRYYNMEKPNPFLGEKKLKCSGGILYVE